MESQIVEVNTEAQTLTITRPATRLEIVKDLRHQWMNHPIYLKYRFPLQIPGFVEDRENELFDGWSLLGSNNIYFKVYSQT